MVDMTGWDRKVVQMAYNAGIRFHRDERGNEWFELTKQGVDSDLLIAYVQMHECERDHLEEYTNDCEVKQYEELGFAVDREWDCSFFHLLVPGTQEPRNWLFSKLVAAGHIRRSEGFKFDAIYQKWLRNSIS